MTGSRVSRAALAAALCSALVACQSAPTPLGPGTAPLPLGSAYVPDDFDRTLRDLGEALLASDEKRADRALGHLAALELENVQGGAEPTGTVAYALDARHALIEDPIARRRLTVWLLRRDDVPAALRSRLEAQVEDDPLRLANQRILDSRTRRYGRAFNRIVGAVGRSFTDTTMMAYRLANAILDVAVAEHMEDALPLEERQALALRKQYIELHPGSPDALALLHDVEKAQRRWYRTQRDRAMQAGKGALEAGDPARAAILADRALRYQPEDSSAQELLERANEQVAEQHAALAYSLTAPPTVPDGEREGRLARALLGTEPIAAASESIFAGDPEDLDDEAHYGLAIAARTAGREDEMWDRLDDISDDTSDNMSRHAWSLQVSPEQNPLRLWRKARMRGITDRLKWLAFGPLHQGPRERYLPAPVEWLLEIPTLFPVITGLPNRLLRLPFVDAQRRSPGVFARRYLERFPDGESAAEVREWLQDYEEDRGNYVGALEVAKARPDEDEEDIAELNEKAAEQALEFARSEPSLADRAALLRQVGVRFEGTEAGREAVYELRQTMTEASPQLIRISRGFLEENPEIAGPRALALRPELMDDDVGNGELHPEGIAFLGAGVLELSYLNEAANPRHDPVVRRQRISEERTARVVAVLEEASLRNARTDSDYPVEYDADRDLFFERVRLGLTQPHHSRAARSSYEFRGMRERYGLVRSREPILPVDLVVQGSFDDMSLGAFPRIRMPKLTPDAFLYR
ncbi:MAG: hypothetical protein ACR2PQ_08525 [Myxococcota bacterium]